MRGIRLIGIATLLLMLLAGTLAIAAQGEGMDTVISQNARMRSGPDSSFDQVALASVGTAIRLDGRNSDGKWVRGITSGGIVGWVSSGTVQITLNDLLGLPVVTVDTPFILSAPSAAAVSSGGGGAATGSGGNDPDGLTVTATANVNIRSGPTTEYRLLGILDTGQPFTLDGRDFSATWVRGIAPDGTIGWVFTQYLSISPTQMQNLPQVRRDAPFNLSAPGSGAPVAVTEGDGADAQSAPVSVPAPIVSSAPIGGFSYGAHIAGFSDFTDNWMRVAGMSWMKKQWRFVDGQSPGEVAHWINEAHARGFRLLLGVTVMNKNDLLNPDFFGRYANFLGGVAALGVDAIEVLNEPNIDHEWPAGNISPERYTELLAVSFNAIKAANPNTLVISAAPAPTGFYGGCTGAGCDDNLFIQRMAAAGAANYTDCVGIHYNEGVLSPTRTSGDPRGNSGHYSRYFQSMINTYYNAFGGRDKLCFTEMGYLSPEGYGPLPAGFTWAGDTSVAEQAQWIREAVDIARNTGRVQLLIIWNMDFTYYGGDPQAGFALIRPGGGCPACEALGR